MIFHEKITVEMQRQKCSVPLTFERKFKKGAIMPPLNGVFLVKISLVMNCPTT